MSIADIFNWISDGINYGINYPIDWFYVGVGFVVLVLYGILGALEEGER